MGFYFFRMPHHTKRQREREGEVRFGVVMMKNDEKRKIERDRRILGFIFRFNDVEAECVILIPWKNP